MKFSVSLGDFQKAIFRVLPAIPPKSTLPVLEHIHCTLINNSLSMIASDQEMTISTSFECHVESEGSVLIPARKLNELIKSLGSEGTVEIDISTNLDLTFTTAAGKFTMKGMNSVDYPMQPVFPEGETALFSSTDIMKTTA